MLTSAKNESRRLVSRRDLKRRALLICIGISAAIFCLSLMRNDSSKERRRLPPSAPKPIQDEKQEPEKSGGLTDVFKIRLFKPGSIILEELRKLAMGVYESAIPHSEWSTLSAEEQGEYVDSPTGDRKFRKNGLINILRPNGGSLMIIEPDIEFFDKVSGPTISEIDKETLLYMMEDLLIFVGADEYVQPLDWHKDSQPQFVLKIQNSSKSNPPLVFAMGAEDPTHLNTGEERSGHHGLCKSCGKRHGEGFGSSSWGECVPNSREELSERFHVVDTKPGEAVAQLSTTCLFHARPAYQNGTLPRIIATFKVSPEEVEEAIEFMEERGASRLG